jgi:hypothetical protein
VAELLFSTETNQREMRKREPKGVVGGLFSFPHRCREILCARPSGKKKFDFVAVLVVAATRNRMRG